MHYFMIYCLPVKVYYGVVWQTVFFSVMTQKVENKTFSGLHLSFTILKIFVKEGMEPYGWPCWEADYAVSILKPENQSFIPLQMDYAITQFTAF